MLLNDKQIRARCVDTARPMISPFNPAQIRKADSGRVISHGLSCVGYDVTLDRTFKVFRKLDQVIQLLPPHLQIIDPKNIQPELLYDVVVKGPTFTLPPRGYVLANTIETFAMPADVAGTCMTKSTYARCGLLVNVTPLEPEWEGFLTLELANLTDLPMLLYVEEGIAQILFNQIEEPETTYADRAGKYMGQPRQPVLPVV